MIYYIKARLIGLFSKTKDMSSVCLHSPDDRTRQLWSHWPRWPTRTPCVISSHHRTSVIRRVLQGVFREKSTMYILQQLHTGMASERGLGHTLQLSQRGVPERSLRCENGFICYLFIFMFIPSLIVSTFLHPHMPRSVFLKWICARE